MRCAAIVLAGGASSRFGSDKLAAAVDGRPLLHRALSAVAAVADPIVLVLAPDAPEPALAGDLAPRVAIARDATPYGGPLAGLAAGLAALATDDPRGIALVVGADMPSLQPTVLRLLVEMLDRDPGLAAVTLAASDPSPLPMAIRPDVAAPTIERILATAGRRSLVALLESIPSATVPATAWRALDPGGRTLRDVDTPEDLDHIS